MFSVFRAIPLSRRLTDRLRHLWAAHVPQLMEFGTHPRFTFRGDQRGAGGAGRAITAHGNFLW